MRFRRDLLVRVFRCLPCKPQRPSFPAACKLRAADILHKESDSPAGQEQQWETQQAGS